ncbi:hypothetical protein Tco_0936512 [Tanacetum coccineum]
MGDENPIRTLIDYSRASHEVYRNAIELPDGNNVVPLRSNTIWLVQNGCSFHGLWPEDPNQHLKDFLKLVDSLDLDVAKRERTPLRLFQFSLRDQPSNWLKRLPAGYISTWEDLTTRESLSEAWTHFKDLVQKVSQHGIDLWLQKRLGTLSRSWPDTRKKDGMIPSFQKKEGWNDPIFPEEGSLNYKNANIEQLLGVMECQVDTLKKDAISLMGKSGDLCGLTRNTMRQLPLEPSHQDVFKSLITNFIIDQEEKVRQLEEYICVIGSDFMQLSLEVAEKLKE